MLFPENTEKIESTGERILYMKFKNDGSAGSYYVLHSVFTNFHLKNISGELDFLILAPGKGIFALEVKHGKVSREKGKWCFQNRKGDKTYKATGPFAQVDGTMNSIRKYLLETLKNKPSVQKRISKLLWGTGVAFTSMEDVVNFGQEGRPWQLLSREGLKLPVGYYIDALSQGWHNEHKNKHWYDVNLSRPTADDCKLILKSLRGDFEINYSEINRILDNESLIEEYTREQFRLLDFVKHNERCLIKGAAGTGKTFMAVEIYRRALQENKKVALFCFNRNLADKLSEMSGKIENGNKANGFVGTFHGFLMQEVGHSVPEEKERQNFYNEHLPLEYIIQRDVVEESEKYDLIILDEAQDLITPYYLEVFDFILKGGIKSGNWTFFGDFCNQAIYLNDPQAGMKSLQQETNFTSFPPLKINCRNTQKITFLNTILTGAEEPEHMAGSVLGEDTETFFPVKNKRLKKTEEIINNYISKNIPLSKITVLSPVNFENTFLNESDFFSQRLNEGLTFSTIHSYKGLENTIVIVLGFEEISSTDAQRLLYIGISRAKQKLYIILNKELEEIYKEQIRKNF